MMYLKLFLIALPIFAATDLVWLGLIMSKFYSEQLGSVGRYVNGALNPVWLSSIIAYILLVAGLAIFVVPAFQGKEIGFPVFLWGALFGLIVYGVYEFTNHAVVAGWPINLVYVDTLWGIFLYGLTSFFTAYIARWLDII